MSRDQSAWDDINEQDDNFDYKKLYITNIPPHLNVEGLRNVFSKYGTLGMCFLSLDKTKRYGLVQYDTAGEAKVAMLSTNKTPPLNLKISYAKKKPTSKEHTETNHFTEKRVVNMVRDKFHDNNMKMENNDTDSISTVRSWGKRSVIMPNIDSATLSKEDISALDELQLNLEMERIELLKAQHRYKVALYNAEKKNQVAGNKTNIQITMRKDGKHIYRTSDDRARGPYDDLSDDFQRAVSCEQPGVGVSTSLWSGPSLMPFATLRCVRCSETAAALCSRCRLTPYCSQNCQRADWAARHSVVCHNLTTALTDTDQEKTTGGPKKNVDLVLPLRKPHFSQPDATNTDAGTSSQQTKKFNNKHYDRQNPDSKPHRENSKHSERKQPNNQGWNIDRRNKGDATKKFDARAKGNDARRNAPVEKGPQRRRDVDDDEDENWGGPSKAPENETARTPENVVKALADEPIAAVQEKRVLEETPAKSIVESVPVGEAVLVSVEQLAAQCRVDGDYVCIALHESYEKAYQALCEDYLVECEASSQKNYEPSAGELYSLYEPTESAWYRARHLGAAQPSALVDAARLAPSVSPAEAPRAPLPRTSRHAETPEFSCVLVTRVDVQIGQQLKCEIVSRDAAGICAVKLADEGGTALGDGHLKRWRPTISIAKTEKTSLSPAPSTNPSNRTLRALNCVTPKTGSVQGTSVATPTTPLRAEPPEPERPQHKSGVEVVIVDAASFDRVFLRATDPATQRAYDMCIEDVAMYGQHAEPLTQPPSVGQLVIAKFTDDIHYRALVTRTNVKQNKYLLEYIEFGNIEKSSIERLYACPSEYDLSHRPARASRAKLHGVVDALTPDAQKYLNDLKQNGTPLIVSLPDGVKTAPSGSEVVLAVAKNMLNVNKNLQEMCTPQWKQLQQKGVDILETKVMMLPDIECVDLPADGGLLQILDAGLLSKGILSACEVGEPNISIVLGPLTDKMAAYCQSDYGREPYLPRLEELCIARFQPHEGWFRAVVVDQVKGAGSPTLLLLYLDYGNTALVEMGDMRRMLPEFAAVPALACHVEIEGVPDDLSEAAVEKAKEVMGIGDDAATGRLRVTSCRRINQGMYKVTAPELLAALKNLM